MLILALAVVAVILIWMFSKRLEGAEPVVRWAAVVWAFSCAGAALALRAGQVLTGLLLVAVSFASLAILLRWRGGGDDGPGDGGREPDTPDPDPGLGRPVPPPVERLDRDAFDRARAEWEQELPKRS